jgi:hypothetical protein
VSLIAVGLLLTTSSSGAASNTITRPDTGGRYTSLKLDSAGFPVISHYDPMAHDLKVVHCGDATCSTGNTVTAPDPTGIDNQEQGQATSLTLANGNVPVVSYFDYRDMKLVHCGNPACSAPTVRTLDSSWPPDHYVGIWSSVALNASGYPVVGYYTEPSDILKVLVCSNATCGTYNAQIADISPTITGLYNSLVLDVSGFPVISYYEQSTADLKVVHCGAADCASGNTITTVDGALGDVGKYTSLALDSSGFPVVSYYNATNGDLKVVHCGDANCTAGNTIVTPDAGGANDVGRHTSLALDAAGNPVVSYYNVTGTALKVLHCGNPTCTASNTFSTPDADGTVGQYTSLALDGSGNPVVSYYDATDGKLNVLHCGDANCSPEPPTPTPTFSPTPMPVGGLTELSDVESPKGRADDMRWWLAAIAIVGIAAVFVGLRRGQS